MNATTVGQAKNEVRFNASEYYYGQYAIGDCFLQTDVYCTLLDELPKKCRMNVRMQAAFSMSPHPNSFSYTDILMSTALFGCLLIKAMYMIGLNWRARGQTKSHCLTYGDVIVASVIDPDLKIHNECLLNSGDGYRHNTKHTCHKHCRDPIPSMNGDDIGHCQVCWAHGFRIELADITTRNVKSLTK